jgi:large subunit ribosomal protein L15
MPLQRRLPKVGFVSHVSLSTAEVRLSELAKIDGDTVDLEALKKANIITKSAKRAKIFASGNIDRAITVKGIGVTKGAKAAIEAAGGKVE